MTITAKGNETPGLTLTGAVPNGINFTDNGDGTATLSGTALQGSGGKYTLTVTATNSLGSSSQTFNLNVDEAPVITSDDNASATVGQAFSFQVIDTGYPKPHLTKSGTLPRGLTWHGSTGIISGIPAANTAGTYPITFTAKNSQGIVTQTFVLTVQ